MVVMFLPCGEALITPASILLRVPAVNVPQLDGFASRDTMRGRGEGGPTARSPTTMAEGRLLLLSTLVLLLLLLLLAPSLLFVLLSDPLQTGVWDPEA